MTTNGKHTTNGDTNGNGSVPSKYVSSIKQFSKPWYCAQCGKRYHRRDKFEMWAPSLMRGIPIMHRIEVRLCVKCAAPRTQRLLTLTAPDK